MIQGVLYNMKSSKFQLLQDVLLKHWNQTEIDLVIDYWALETHQPVYMLTPHLVQHLGAVSGFPGKNRPNKLFKYTSPYFDEKDTI